MRFLRRGERTERHLAASTPSERRGTEPDAASQSVQERGDAVHELVTLTRLDTLYADLYLHRARSLLAPVMNEERYRAVLSAGAQTSELTDRLQRAIEQDAWEDVRALSARLSAIRRAAADQESLLGAAREVYEFAGELVDPFSPGLSAIAGVAGQKLPALRDQAVQGLRRLQDLDPEWNDLYGTRRDAFAALQLGEARPDAPERPVRERAEQALRAGDYDLLEKLASQFGSKTDAAPGASESLRFPTAVRPLTCTFSAEALASAARLGLVPVHVASARHRVAGLDPLLWRPARDEEESAAQGPLRIPTHVAPDAPEALRERLQLYLDRPFVNCGGARDLPSLDEEDLLVETFDEAPSGVPPANPALLEALGLRRRGGVSRTAIDRALGLRGNEVVRELGLDPREFRLVCIPQDLHVRIGETRSWGTQQIWTHLDGWMVLPNRNFLALAGGDVRFGGIYDLVGVGRDYDPERLIARFAVVLRRRMAAW